MALSTAPIVFFKHAGLSLLTYAAVSIRLLTTAQKTHLRDRMRTCLYMPKPDISTMSVNWQ